MAKRAFSVPTVIALVRDPRRNASFRGLGVRVVNNAYSTALIIESMALSDDAFSLAADLDEMHEVREIKVQNESIVGTPIFELDLPSSVHVLLILRGDTLITPEKATLLQANDILTIVGDERDVESALRLLRVGR